ncbi:MAG: HdeD family acid-resistance protein [Eggerthellaceae bacterium]|jgi:uncharacterized membrane protein HdeD (DUF308 family)
MNWQEQVRKTEKHSFVFGIIAAILMLVIGIAMLCNPLASLRALLWIIIVGFFVGGIFRIYSYTQMPYWLRQGYSLTIGILDIICGVLIMVPAINQPLLTDEVFAIFMGCVVGVFALFAGINTLASSGIIRRMGGSIGWTIAAGILEVIAGILLIMVPQFGSAFLMVALALVFIMGGVSLFAAAIDLRNRAKAFEDYMNRADTVFDPDTDPFINWKMH